MQNLCILQGKISQNVIFWKHAFVQNPIFTFFQNKILHVVYFLI